MLFRSANIMEFLDDVLDVERNNDFYSALFKWSCRVFHDNVVTAVLACPDARLELIERVAVDEKFQSELFNENAEGLGEVLMKNTLEFQAFINEKMLEYLVTQHMDELSEALVKHTNAVFHIAELEPVQQAVMQCNPEGAFPSDRLINEVVHRYHNYSSCSEVRHWISDLQLNDPRALARR